jgi:anti-sigma factor ChrR (cupin superfamily)
MGEIFERRASATKPLALPRGESISIDAASLHWQDCGADGFAVKPLLEDRGSGLRTWLMKVEAGAFSELHAHDEIEQIYVIEGSFYDQLKTYRAGDYIVRAPGAMHTAGSESGALVMLVYSAAAESA